MTRQRLYNPAQLTSEELKASFVARKDTLAEMLRLIREQTPGRPCQHMMLIGPRGMGKTTLGLRLLHEILETPELAADWQPVAFHEESYGIGDLADFWLAALRHLTRATDDPQWGDKAKALPKDEKDTDRQAAYALASLMDFCQTSGKRLLLFVENLDTVLEQLSDERQIHALRASLIERTDILLIGSANTVFEAIRSHGEPLYEFFRLFILKGLGPEETRRILAALADGEGESKAMEALDHEQGRLETIRRLTGGNPRLVVLACRILIESPLGSAFEDLERLIDEQTPYFKARIEELPVQARKVFHCLAEGWKPMPAREVAEAAKLNSSHASAQLRQLMERGYAREVNLPGTKRALYEVGDRFYNIYYLLRFSRTGRDRLARLVAFLYDLFGPSGMRTMYVAALEALRVQGPPAIETSNLLSVLSNYVARDKDFTGREDWLRGAIELAKKTIGANTPVVGEIHEAFAEYSPATSAKFNDIMNRGAALLRSGHFEDAEASFRAVIEERPDHAGAWLCLGVTLMCANRFETSLTAFDRVNRTLSDDTLPLQILARWALLGKCFALSRLKQYDAIVMAVDEHQTDDAPDHTALSRYVTASLLAFKGDALSKLRRFDEAMSIWNRIVKYTRKDDLPDLRGPALRSLSAKGSALAELDRLDEAISTCDQIPEYVHVQDPPNIRHAALSGLLFARATALLKLNRLEDLSAVCLSALNYLRPNDPSDLRRQAITAIVSGAYLLNVLGRHVEAETVCKKATIIEPADHEAWRVVADAILRQKDSARLVEAGQYARRAAALAPENGLALLTLFDTLACQSNWTEALGALERALRLEGDDIQEHRQPALTASLIKAVAAGHGLWVKQVMGEFSLIESMEPLWHAVRAELGEKLEPLPIEIMDAVTEIRRNFISNPKNPSEAT